MFDPEIAGKFGTGLVFSLWVTIAWLTLWGLIRGTPPFGFRDFKNNREFAVFFVGGVSLQIAALIILFF